jgi:hypothetical protein
LAPFCHAVLPLNKHNTNVLTLKLLSLLFYRKIVSAGLTVISKTVRLATTDKTSQKELVPVLFFSGLEVVTITQ